jgi:hypothetical protein
VITKTTENGIVTETEKSSNGTLVIREMFTNGTQVTSKIDSYGTLISKEVGKVQRNLNSGANTGRSSLSFITPQSSFDQK